MFKQSHYGRPQGVLTALAAAWLALLSLPSCNASLDMEVEEERPVGTGERAIGYSMSLGHMEGCNAWVVMKLGDGEPQGVYGISAGYVTADGRRVSETKGDILLVPGMARTISLPVGRGEAAGEIRCTLTGSDGRRASTKSVSVSGDDLREGVIYGPATLPETVEMSVGRTYSLPLEVIGTGAVVKAEGDVTVEKDSFGCNVTPLSEGVSGIVITDGAYSRRMAVNAVEGPVSPVLYLPENIVLLQGAESMLVASVLPYGSAPMECSWSVDRDGIVSVGADGSAVLLRGVSEGTARVTVSSSAGTATTTVRVIEGRPLTRVTSVSLSPSDMTLESGEQAGVRVSFEPSDADLGNIRWCVTGDEESIDLEAFELKGTVTGLYKGNATVTVDIDGVQSSLTVNVTSGDRETPIAATGDIEMPERIVMSVGSETVVRAQFKDGAQPSGCSWTATPEGYVGITRTDGASVFLKALKEGQTDLMLTSGNSVGVTHVNIIGGSGSEPGQPDQPEQPEQPGGDLDKLESVTLPAAAELTEGESLELTAILTPSSYVPERMSWSCSTDGTAEITLDGKGPKATVTAVKAGTATVTVNVDGKTASTRVTVKAKPEPEVELQTVSLSASPTSMMAGQTASLTASFAPENYVPESIQWTSSPSGIFNVVSDGTKATATAVSPGTATVTVDIDGKTASVELTATKPEPAYAASLNATEFFEGQKVELSFTGSAVEGMDTELKLDGEFVVFGSRGVVATDIEPGSHTYSLVQKVGSYVVDSREFNFTVYATPAPVVTVTGDSGTETFQSAVCLRKYSTVSMDVQCQGYDSFESELAESSSSVFTPVGGKLYCQNIGESAVNWSARKGGAYIEGKTPIVVYDVISVKVSAYTKNLSVDSCYLTVDVIGNDYGTVTASNVVFEPHYRLLLPDGKEVTHTGKTITAGTIDLTLGSKNEYNVAADVNSALGKITALGYNMSDVGTIYISLKASGTLSGEYLVVRGQGDEIQGALAGANETLKEYFK